MDPTSLRDWLGDIDIYLLDQILRGRLHPGMRILDAGCGDGRNLVWLLRSGHDVSAVDRDPEQIRAARALAHRLAPALPADRFRVEELGALSFEDASFDFVICSAVLHFAPGLAAFESIFGELWRVLAPGGVFFARLASTIGIEDRIRASGVGRYVLPDGTERFLVDEAFLMRRTEALAARLLDPLKTTIVQDRRAMTTWVIGKPE